MIERRLGGGEISLDQLGDRMDPEIEKDDVVFLEEARTDAVANEWSDVPGQDDVVLGNVDGAPRASRELRALRHGSGNSRRCPRLRPPTGFNLRPSTAGKTDIGVGEIETGQLALDMAAAIGAAVKVDVDAAKSLARSSLASKRRPISASHPLLPASAAELKGNTSLCRMYSTVDFKTLRSWMQQSGASRSMTAQ